MESMNTAASASEDLELPEIESAEMEPTGPDIAAMADYALSRIRFGTLFKFFVKVIGAWILALIPYALFAAIVFAALRSNAQEAVVTLPEGIHADSIDLGPSGTVGVHRLGGNVYSVHEGRDELQLTRGAMFWRGKNIATLWCSDSPCTLLKPGDYVTRFVIRNEGLLGDEAIIVTPRLDRKGRPKKGKPLSAVYLIEWQRWAEVSKVKNQFLSALSSAN